MTPVNILCLLENWFATCATCVKREYCFVDCLLCHVEIDKKEFCLRILLPCILIIWLTELEIVLYAQIMCAWVYCFMLMTFYLLHQKLVEVYDLELSYIDTIRHVNVNKWWAKSTDLKLSRNDTCMMMYEGRSKSFEPHPFKRKVDKWFYLYFSAYSPPLSVHSL